MLSASPQPKTGTARDLRPLAESVPSALLQACGWTLVHRAAPSAAAAATNETLRQCILAAWPDRIFLSQDPTTGELCVWRKPGADALPSADVLSPEAVRAARLVVQAIGCRREDEFSDRLAAPGIAPGRAVTAIHRQIEANRAAFETVDAALRDFTRPTPIA